jgi:hypothetical protein
MNVDGHPMGCEGADVAPEHKAGSHCRHIGSLARAERTWQWSAIKVKVWQNASSTLHHSRDDEANDSVWE